MKKTIALILTTALVLTSCSSNTENTSKNLSKDAPVAVSETIDNDEAESSTDTDLSTGKETEAVDNTEGNEENIEIIMPALYMDGATQEQLDQDYAPYATATLNEDKSVTFVMSKALHAAFVEIIGGEITSELNSLVGTSDFPNVTSVEHNDNFTEFNITTSSSELSQEESLSAIYPYIFGKMYNIFNQTEENTITVNFLNANSNEIIYTSDAAQMDALLETAE